MKRPVTSLTLLLCLGLATVSARAAMVHGQMTGRIAEQAETRGLGNTVFGLDGSALLGQAFTIDFSYDTDSAPLTATTRSAIDSRTVYDSSDPTLDWLALSITVNGNTFAVAGAAQRADILDHFAVNPSNFPGDDRLQLAVAGGMASADGSSFRRQFLDVTVWMPDTTLDASTLPTALFSDQILRVFNSATFLINEFDIDPGSGNLSYERYVNFNLDIQQIEATVVPLPATLPLFTASLIGLLVLRRKYPRPS